MKNTLPKHYCLLCFFWLTSITLSACGGGGGKTSNPNGAGTPTLDTTAPTVKHTSPANNITNVARNSQISATFDEDIFAKSINANTFTLTADKKRIIGQVKFDSINNTATFSPNTKFKMQTPYSATLQATITDLSGNTLTKPYGWSFVSADGAWRDTALFDGGEVGHTSTPQIVMNQLGKAFAIWPQSDGSQVNIWARQYDGKSWGKAQMIETDNSGDTFSPQIAISNDGKAFAIWIQYDGLDFDVMTNYFDGAKWGTAKNIETLKGKSQAPQITFDHNNNAIAVWAHNDGTQTSIFSNYFNGTNWGMAKEIETKSGDATSPQVAFDDKGNAMVIWSQVANGSFHVWTNHYNKANASWSGAEFIANTTATSHSAQAQIAFNPKGGAIAVWRQTTTKEKRIWVNHFDGEQWNDPIKIDRGT